MKDKVTPQEAQIDGQGGVDSSNPQLTINHDKGKTLDSKAAAAATDGLSNEEISLLCDIGEGKAVDKSLDGLIAKLEGAGYVDAATQPSPGLAYRLTKKAQDFLRGRGAGLNEA